MSTDTNQTEAVGSPVERPVRPLAWALTHRDGRVTLHHDADYATAYRDTCVGEVPLYPGDEMVAPLLTALRHAWTGNHKAAEAYALLAAQHLEDKGERLQAKCLRETVEVLTGKREPVFVHVA